MVILRMIPRLGRDGRQRTFGYDAANRPTAETWVGGSYTATYAYDAANRLTSESDPNSTYTMSYDNANRLTNVDNHGTPGAPHVALSYGYDQYSNRTSLGDNLSNSITYSYDADNRLTSENSTAEGGSGQIGLAYDAASRLTQTTQQSGSPNPITDTISYDSANRVTSMSYSAVNLSFTYSYDAASRVTAYTGPEGTLNYSYDSANELTGVSGALNAAYSYDKNGNRTMTGYSTTTGNRLSSDGTYSYTYDNEGNLTTQTTIATGAQTVYSWDYRNRLTEVVVKNSSGGTVTDDVFTYDVENRRIAKSVNGTKTWTVYDGANPYADFTSSGSLTEQYLYGLAVDQLFARVSATGQFNFYLTDRLGSVREIVVFNYLNPTVLDQINYDSFGAVTYESNAANGDRFKFTGREYDAELGLYEYRNRYTDPADGRFISEDPEGFGAGDANLYRYAQNQPTGLVDPLGLIEWELARQSLMRSLRFVQGMAEVGLGAAIGMGTGWTGVGAGVGLGLFVHGIDQMYTALMGYKQTMMHQAVTSLNNNPGTVGGTIGGAIGGGAAGWSFGGSYGGPVGGQVGGALGAGAGAVAGGMLVPGDVGFFPGIGMGIQIGVTVGWGAGTVVGPIAGTFPRPQPPTPPSIGGQGIVPDSPPYYPGTYPLLVAPSHRRSKRVDLTHYLRGSRFHLNQTSEDYSYEVLCAQLPECSPYSHSQSNRP
jgi:RHS repeat-associated protein